MSPRDAGARELASTLDHLGAANDRHAWFVPGRIEVLGKHTDYAGGRSLLCATEQGIAVAAAPRRDSTVRVVDVERSTEVELSPSGEVTAAAPGWARYPAAVLRRLVRDFPPCDRGAEIVLASDLPTAAGLASSSALVVGLATALAEVNGLPARAEFRRAIPDDLSLATYWSCVESGRPFGRSPEEAGVGTQGGSEDHVAILCCRAGELAGFRFRPTREEARIPLPRGLRFAVAVSGVRAEKTGSARHRYNRLSELAETLVALWQEATGGREETLGAILERDGAFESLRRQAGRNRPGRFSSRELVARLEQFRVETEEVVPAACAALAAGDLEGFGQAVQRSVEAGARGLANQVPETLALTAGARASGALAASPFGAGFGGSVWALVPATGADAFLDAWRREYHAEFPSRAAAARFLLSDAAPGLTRLNLQEV